MEEKTRKINKYPSNKQQTFVLIPLHENAKSFSNMRPFRPHNGSKKCNMLVSQMFVLSYYERIKNDRKTRKQNYIRLLANFLCPSPLFYFCRIIL